MHVLIEFVALLVALLLAITVPSLKTFRIRPFTAATGWLTRSSARTVAATGLLVLAAQIAIGFALLHGIPVVHDEFAYLLSADTFAQGRLTNPTHPFWQHFESFHIIQQPSYQAKYPPAQGFVLAFGQAAFGKPIVGAWINVALASAAVCWMLLAYVPRRWALFGALLTSFSPGVLVYWGQTYWGGGVAMFGGALMFGALPRILRHRRVTDSLWLALGVVLLANSRPYEGLIACLPVAFVLVRDFFRTASPQLPSYLRNAIIPIVAVFAVAAVGMARYNAVVTGDPWTLPYQVWQQTYMPDYSIGAAMFGVNQPLPDGHHFQLRQHDALLRTKLMRQFFFYFHFALGISLVCLPWMLRSSWIRFYAIVCTLVLTAVLVANEPAFPHYTAMLTAPFALLIVQGLRQLRLWQVGPRPTGRRVVAALPLICAIFLIGFLYHHQTVELSPTTNWALYRESIIRELEGVPNRDLVIVHYRDRHDPHREWVYNKAEIDEASIVWARDLGPRRNTALVQYFDDRRIWLLDADVVPPVLRPYANRGRLPGGDQTVSAADAAAPPDGWQRRNDPPSSQ